MDNESVFPDYVSQAREKAEGASSFAADFATRAITIPDVLKKTITDTLKENKELFEQRSQTLSDYLAAPEKAEARFGIEESPYFVFNPFERGEAIAEFVSAKEIPFLTANSLLGMLMGGGEKLIGAGTRAFQAQATAEQGRAELLRQGYQDVLGEFLSGEQLKISKRELELKEQEAKRKAAGARTYRINLPGYGPVDVTAGQLLDYYSDVNGQIELTGKEKTDFASYRALIEDMENIRSRLTDQGRLKNLFTPQTGPISSFLSSWLPGEDLRVAIDDFKSDVQYEKYGGALTETEVKEAKKWVPGSARQEHVNISRLNRQIEKKTNELTNLMSVSGFSADQINTFLSSGEIPKTSFGGGFDLLNAEEWEEVE